jgi:ADP-ribosylglycohydrolase
MKVNTIENTFLGLALADALGVPVEFKSRTYLSENPVASMLEFGTHHQRAGTWSDDSSLTFCLAHSLRNGYDLKDIALKFIQWTYGDMWTPYGSVFDIGIQTRKSINTLELIFANEDYESLKYLKNEADEYTNGNGSLMRILPLLFYIKDKSIKEQFEIVWEVSALTHGHIRSAISCLIYLKFAEYILDELSIEDAYFKTRKTIKTFFETENISKKEIKHFERLINHDISKYEEQDIKSDGYVLHTLEASFWCLLKTNSYLDAVFKAINLGNDTDTTATVVGGVAGLVYGLDNVPEKWLNTLARKNDILKLSEEFSKAYQL